MAAHPSRVLWVRVIGLFNTWSGVLGTGLQQPLAESLRPQQKLGEHWEGSQPGDGPLTLRATPENVLRALGTSRLRSGTRSAGAPGAGPGLCSEQLTGVHSTCKGA